MSGRRLSRSIVNALGVATLAANLVQVVPFLRESLRHVSRLRTATPDERMELHWGELYRVSLLIREATPPSTTILIPHRLEDRDAVWYDVGNEHIVKSFLHPRRVVLRTDAEWRALSSRAPESGVVAVVATREMGGRVHVWPPKEAIAGWRTILLPSGWGIAVSPGGRE